ncbi:MAG: T9SS type A sorting domain-containing protein [Ignavibacteria bacterium]|nr:T9SS type A sorting domain-containing protein [Ignavibacteria bacterium]
MRIQLQYALIAVVLFTTPVCAQTTMATYAGGAGNETFNDVVQLSNGNIIVLGAANSITWVDNSVPQIQLTNPGITNNNSTGKYAFICEFDSTLQTMLRFYYLPAGAAEDFKFIKTTNIPGTPTGDVYISGTTEDSNSGGYFIGKLNTNFVTGAPSGFSWVYNVSCTSGGNPKIYQPWDVGSDGAVVFAGGDSHAYNWSVIHKLDASGIRTVVDDWRVHWQVAGGEYYGEASQHPNGPTAISYSGIVFKRDANRCELRSTNMTDYTQMSTDGNGGMKQGKWPLDVLYNSPCNPGQSGNTTSGPGYTGYGPPGTFTYGPQSIAIDRRTNYMYIGFNAKSVLPDGNPDFEPAVMAMDNNGGLIWWSRLYHELQPNGDTVNSSPDQYIDALAIDYSMPASTGYLVVQARCHGNNVENLWEGNSIAANPSASGFQNQFTGSNGNIHISWLGKLTLAAGTLMHSTYVAEYNNTTTGLGTAHPDPNLDNWPNPNGGWPNVNTTYLAKNMLKVTADGSVVVLGKGRRTITTANAHQKMVKQTWGGNSCWNDYVRMYEPDFSVPLYSSLVVGQWDTVSQQGGDNVRLYGMFKTAHGIITVGKHTGAGNEIPVAAVPGWGNANFNGESAVLVYHRAANIVNNFDSPVVITTSTTEAAGTSAFTLYPNPATEVVNISFGGSVVSGQLVVLNLLGQPVSTTSVQTSTLFTIDTSVLDAGVYLVQWTSGGKTTTGRLVVQH